MGLDFVGSDAHWAYSGFMRFRSRLADAEGFELTEMVGYGTIDRPWSEVTTTLQPFFDHSDCDGYLSPSEMKQIIPRMQEIINTWPEDDYDRVNGQRLIDGMQECILIGQQLIFA